MRVVAGTRDRLLAATNESFRKRGYNGTSLKQVTSAANAPTGSLYHFFPGGKDDLAAAVITTSGAAYRELFEAIADAAASPEAAVTDFFDGAAAVLEETDFIDPCPIGTVAREVASTNEPLRIATEQVFAGWIDSRAQADLLARTDVLAVPSLWPEPFGLVGIEAGMRGVPAIAFDVGGIAEWLRDGVSGRLVPVSRAPLDAFAAALLECLALPAARFDELRAGARQEAARFTVAAHVDGLEAIFAEAGSRAS